MRALAAEIDERSGGRRGGLDRDAITIDGSGELKVVSVSQGIFYGAPAPDKPAFVEVGDTIDTSRTLCLLEAMKLFDEISLESFNRETELYDPEATYEVVRVNAADGQLVNEGDLLFVVRPIGPIAA